MTPDHEPQNSVMRLLKQLRVHTAAGGLARVFPGGANISGYGTSQGISLNMLRARHLETRTYGPAGARTKQQAVSALGIAEPSARSKVMTGVVTAEAARARVRRTMDQALAADHCQVRAIYADPRWRLPSSVPAQVRAALGRVCAQNRGAWPEVF